MGAIASGGIVIRNPRLRWIPQEIVDNVAQEERLELERRENLYRGNRDAPDITGKRVILVDDGLATGSTMRAALQAVRRQHPTEIVVVIPVGAPESVDSIRGEADEVVCLATPSYFLAIGEFYKDFAQVSDDEVRQLLTDACKASTVAPVQDSQ